MEERIISPARGEEEANFEVSLRPQTLDEYVGQENIKENLRVFIKAAGMRQEALDHVLLCGPPGLGKTTLSNIIANEIGVDIKATSGPAIERPIDLLVLLKNLKENDVLFIDEIHRLNRATEEILYSAMEDFTFDRVISQSSVVKSAKIKLPKFTLIGATTRSGMLTSPLRNRFGINFNLDFYSPENLKDIIMRSSRILDIEVEEDAGYIIAHRSRGTPRVANRLLKRVRDFAQVAETGIIDSTIANDSLYKLGIDSKGLDELDIKIMHFIIEKFNGGPVGIETLAHAVNEESENIEQVYEPYLIQLGFINKTSRGRCAGISAYEHLGLEVPQNSQISLL
ncbi:MAG: Holliday junction branch migration DNA helicase RuvB [Armatimonadota bacterium]